MDEIAEKYMKQALEGYKGNLDRIEQYLEQTRKQIEEAETSKETMLEVVAELQEAMGIDPDADAEEEEGAEEESTLKLVED